MTTDKAVIDETLTSEKILDVARDQVRRFSEAKINVVDIARALGTSHTTIYRHFRYKAEVFDAIVGAAMQDEEELARTFVDSQGSASERLEGFVLHCTGANLNALRTIPRCISSIDAWSTNVQVLFTIVPPE